MGLINFINSKLAQQRRQKDFDRRPDRIILVRHGESEGNVDREVYTTKADSKLEITDTGWAQGGIAGAMIRKLIGTESVRFFHSPYLRAQQTLIGMLNAFTGETVEISSEPRLREQDFGNFQNYTQMEEVFRERQKFGRFYYRFPNGEAGTDVYDRMASFITYLFRTTQASESGYFEGNNAVPAKNYVIVTHGLLMRVFCMCYLRWSVKEFEQVWNPKNGEIWVLNKIPKQGTYELAGKWRSSPHGGAFTQLRFGVNQSEPMYHHMKSPIVSRRITPGAPDMLDSDELAHFRTASTITQIKSKRAENVVECWRHDQKDKTAHIEKKDSHEENSPEAA
jgi:broad specificity phosphatase PhoE